MGKRSIKLIYEKDSNKNDSLKIYSLSVLVDNEAGALARVVSMFSARGFNIDSLTVAQVETDENLSRITITTSSTDRVIDQIKAQLERLVPVHKVLDLGLKEHLYQENLFLQSKMQRRKRLKHSERQIYLGLR